MKNNTINKKEIEKFSKIAEEWWDPEGKFKPLHKFNPIRISYIKNNIIQSFKLKNKNKPLEKVKILDIGCGGGLLCEPMSRLGANVVGIDASDKNIKVAKLHAKKNNLDIKYLCATPETFKTEVKFDVILNMEIVEHVENVDFFLKSSSELFSNPIGLNKSLSSTSIFNQASSICFNFLFIYKFRQQIRSTQLHLLSYTSRRLLVFFLCML